MHTRARALFQEYFVRFVWPAVSVRSKKIPSFLGFQEIKNTFAANCYCAFTLAFVAAIKDLDVHRRVCDGNHRRRNSFFFVARFFLLVRFVENPANFGRKVDGK